MTHEFNIGFISGLCVGLAITGILLAYSLFIMRKYERIIDQILEKYGKEED